MLRWRLLLGTTIIAGLVLLCWLDYQAAIPGVWLMPVAVVLTVLATGEVLQLVRAAGLQPPGWLVYAGNLLQIGVAWLASWAGNRSVGIPPPDGASWLLLAFTMMVLALFAVEIRRYEAPGGTIANLAGGVLATAYTGLLMGLLVQFRVACGIGALAALVIVVKSGDIGAYTVGRLVGRHKLAPRLSPGKTIEGAFGALAAGCLAAWATFRWILPAVMPEGSSRLPWGAWLAFGLVVATAGILGDLGESLLKRDVQRKDSSAWLPGFGGVLDIMDSILFAAPVAYGYWVVCALGK
ncbi:MAG: phosphatidate cytidylyltransferase [Rhodopirellula sp.]|nr:phosphatidate cytidylyltransferase [Rhodopirellula sp.]